MSLEVKNIKGFFIKSISLSFLRIETLKNFYNIS